MLIVRNYYVPFMSAAGILIGAAVVAQPSLSNFFIPPFLWLLGISLTFEIFVGAMASKLEVVPLSSQARFAGFFSGACLYFLITYVFAKTVAVV